MQLTAMHYTVLGRIADEIDRANKKHGNGNPLATDEDVALILLEELGEYAQALLKGQPMEADKELVQIAAVAFNHLVGTGPHRSKL